MEARFPDIRVEKIARALKDEVQDLLTRSSTRGIAVFGSVGRGDYTEDSDTEMQVVDSDTPEPKTSLTVRHGVLIHKHIRDTVELAGRASIAWQVKPPFADSWIIIDRDGQLARLKKLDNEIAMAGRRKPSDEQVADYRRRLTARLHELTRFQDNPEHMALFCYEAVVRAVEIFYAQRRRWYPGSKKVMKDMAALYPEVYRLVDAALRPDNEQVRNAISLVRFVLDELGGPDAFEDVDP